MFLVEDNGHLTHKKKCAIMLGPPARCSVPWGADLQELPHIF